MRLIFEAFRISDIRKKLLWTLALLILFRIGSYIPTPGVNPGALNAADFTDNEALGALNTFSGGSLSRFSILALGIMPYITASIVMQMMQAIHPKLIKLRADGESGQTRITQLTRYMAVGLAGVQAIVYTIFLKNAQIGDIPVLLDNSLLSFFTAAFALAAGAVIVMWIGESISRLGVGNGISLVIMASIAAGLPGSIDRWWRSPDQTFQIVLPVVVMLVVLCVVFFQEGLRRLPLTYFRQNIGGTDNAMSRAYFPMRLNFAGIIPVIFAGSLMAMFPLLGRAFDSPAIEEAFAYGSIIYVIVQSVLVFFFAYFYTGLTFNPLEQASDLRSSGGFINNVVPGRPTADILDRTLSRLTLPGALYLALLVAIPTLIISAFNTDMIFSGTSVIIVVGVSLQTVKQIKSLVETNSYDRKLVIH